MKAQCSRLHFERKMVTVVLTRRPPCAQRLLQVYLKRATARVFYGIPKSCPVSLSALYLKASVPDPAFLRSYHSTACLSWSQFARQQVIWSPHDSHTRTPNGILGQQALDRCRPHRIQTLRYAPLWHGPLRPDSPGCRQLLASLVETNAGYIRAKPKCGEL